MDRAASTGEVTGPHREARELKDVVAEQTMALAATLLPAGYAGISVMEISITFGL